MSTEPPKQPTSSEETPAQAALRLAKIHFTKHWAECGDSWLTRVTMVNGDYRAPNSYIQWKSVKTRISPDELSPADRLNGVIWHGKVFFEPIANRVFLLEKIGSQGPGWLTWSSSYTAWSFEITNNNGIWTVTPDLMYPKNTTPVQCAEVPP